MTEIKPTAESLFAAIQHGDDEHRAWLQEAIEAHFAGRPVPECRGSGRKEARIASLLNGLREAREALAGLLAHPGTHHDRCIHWEEVGCDCEFSEITNGARAVIAKLDTLLSQEGGQ